MEDEDDIRDQICVWFRGMAPADGRPCTPTPFNDFEEAKAGLLDRRFDIAILDIFQGRGGVPPSPGLDIIERIKQTAFVPVVVYTALPERLAGIRSPLIRVVAKGAGLSVLEAEVRQIVGWRLPQLARALRATFDDTLRDYMWRFVDANWDRFEPMVDKPDFGRLVVQRLAEAYSSEGAGAVLDAAYGGSAAARLPADRVHPASVYVMPVGSGVLRLGDIREGRDQDGHPLYVVVLQPSCDTVKNPPDGSGQGARNPNVGGVLCAGARPSPPRRSEHEFALPTFLAVPELLVEFRDLRILPFDDLLRMECIARIASPFAEQLAAKFAAYIGRIGTPEIQPPPAIGT